MKRRLNNSRTDVAGSRLPAQSTPSPFYLVRGWTAVTIVVGSLVLAGCRNTDRDVYNSSPGPTCIENGVCDRDRDGGWPENCFNCPNDCCVECDLATITPAVPRDFLVSEMRWPGTERPVALGLDLDGDWGIDNNGGMMVSIFESDVYVNLSDHVNRRIARGELLMVIRIYADSLAQDETVLVQVLPVVSVDGTPLFDGSDEVMIAPGTLANAFSCGTIVGGALNTYPQPGGQLMQCPLCPVTDELVSLQSVRLAGSVAWQQLTDLDIAGGMLSEEMYDVFVPDMVTLINETILADLASGDGTTADALSQYFDGNCVMLEDIPGCEEVQYGIGECDDTAYPPHISVTELRCNPLVFSMLRPDLDLDHDGVDDLISIGWRVSAVPVIVVDGS